MTKRTALLTRITQAEALPSYWPGLRYEGGAAGVVDMSGTVAKSGVFAALAGARFSAFTIADGGRAVCWPDDAGSEVDFDADSLRLRLREVQAAAG